MVKWVWLPCQGDLRRLQGATGLVLCTQQVLSKGTWPLRSVTVTVCEFQVLTGICSQLNTEIYVTFCLPGTMLGSLDLLSDIMLSGVSFHYFLLEVTQTFRGILLVGFQDCFQ